MKNRFRYLFILSVVLQAMSLSAQLVEDEDTTANEPFFKATRFNSRCYVAIDGMVGQILKNKVAMISGFSLNWVVNHKYVTSAYYDMLGPQLNIQFRVDPDHPGNTINLSHQSAGLGFGYIFFNDKKFSLQPEIEGSWARAQYSIGSNNYRSDFAMFIPTIYSIYNVTKYFRFGVGLNYRISVGCTLSGIKDADLSGIGGMVFVRLGTF